MLFEPFQHLNQWVDKGLGIGQPPADVSQWGNRLWAKILGGGGGPAGPSL